MKKLMYLAIGMIIVLGFIFIETNDKGEQIPKQSAQKPIKLSFTPQPTKEVPSIAFENTWKLRKTIQLSNVSGAEKALLLFYETSEGQAKLLLKDNDGFYDLSLEAKAEDIEADVNDINSDGINELIVSANLGATVRAVKILNFSRGKWLYLLDGENFIIVDLDYDGISEIVETSMGSLPGYVNLYRWKGSQYGKSDLLKDTGYAQVTFVIGENGPVFELTKDNKTERYKYREGKLVPVLGK